MRSLRARGLENIQLVISDSHSGVAAIRTVFLGAAWQRCRGHFVRDVFLVIERGSGEMVAATIRTVFAQTTGEDELEADGVGRRKQVNILRTLKASRTSCAVERRTLRNSGQLSQ